MTEVWKSISPIQRHYLEFIVYKMKKEDSGPTVLSQQYKDLIIRFLKTGKYRENYQCKKTHKEHWDQHNLEVCRKNKYWMNAYKKYKKEQNESNS